jgi:hypothetical protein
MRQQSVAAGETAQLMLSSSAAYNVSIYRLGPSLDSMHDDVLIHSFPTQEPRVQPIHPGSYVHAAPLKSTVRMLSVRLWIRPYKTTAPSREKLWAGMVTACNLLADCAFGLLLGPDKRPGFYLAPGGERAWDRKYLHMHTRPLELGVWHHVVAVWDGQHKSIWVNGTSAGFAFCEVKWRHVHTRA